MENYLLNGLCLAFVLCGLTFAAGSYNHIQPRAMLAALAVSALLAAGLALAF
jgi:hypothetical protein